MPRQTKCFSQGIPALVCSSYSRVQFVFTVGLKIELEIYPFWNLEAQHLIGEPLWLGACGWRTLGHWPCTVRSGSVPLANRQGLYRCHIILQVSRYKRHAHRAFKPTAHCTLTLHTRTTHPLTHIYTHNVQTWIHLLLYPPGNDHHTVTLYPNGDHIHDPPTAAVQVCVPVHVPMVCTAAFFRGCMC
jgi:hypothetical protein